MASRNRVAATVKLQLQLQAGQASPGKVGQSLGVHGINIVAFIAAYNRASAAQHGMVVPAVVTVYDDRSFDLQLKTPPTSALLASAAGLPKGSGRLGADGPVASSTATSSARSPAPKLPDLNTDATWTSRSSSKLVPPGGTTLAVAITTNPENPQHQQFRGALGVGPDASRAHPSPASRTR